MCRVTLLSPKRGTVRAVLAGGLVLGVGAAVTLAAWTSDDFATGTFSAGTFAIEGSVNGSAYVNHSSTSPASLSFDSSAAGLSPDTTTYSAYAVRLAAGTTDGATATLTSAGTSGTVSDLTYGIVETTTFGCDAAQYTAGTSLVTTGTALGTVPASTTVTLAPGSPTADPGAPVYLCIAVTAGANLAQGQSGTATWQFSATSN
jgi:predicted ribosomally synthesized peptide with SipW-like signal peptide